MLIKIVLSGRFLNETSWNCVCPQQLMQKQNHSSYMDFCKAKEVQDNNYYAPSMADVFSLLQSTLTSP